MSTFGGMLSDAYGIKASLASNILLMVPCAVLSWFLFRTKEGAAAPETIAAKRAQVRRRMGMSVRGRVLLWYSWRPY